MCQICRFYEAAQYHLHKALEVDRPYPLDIKEVCLRIEELSEFWLKGTMTSDQYMEFVWLQMTRDHLYVRWGYALAAEVN